MKFRKGIENKLNEEEYPSMTDGEILREAIKEEYYASNLYHKLARKAQNQDVKRVLLHVAGEEKEHIGEFEALLEKIDPDHEEHEDKGEEEVEKELKIDL